MIAIPAIGYRWGRWNPVLAFWSSYVLTRPLGAALADWSGKPPESGGLGWGSGRVGLVLVVLIVVSVAYLTVTRSDAPGEPAPRRARAAAPRRLDEKPGYPASGEGSRQRVTRRRGRVGWRRGRGRGTAR